MTVWSARWFAACAGAALLALPATARGVAVALTTVGGDPGVAADVVTKIPRTTTGVQFYDFHLDIGATPASLTHPVNYVDGVSFSFIFDYQFVLEAGPGTFFPGPLFASGYTPDPAWLTQFVSGDPDFASWNDFAFANTIGVPINTGLGGFQPGFLRLGTVFIDVGSSLAVGNPILSLFDGGNTFVDGPAERTFPVGVILVVPEPSVALLLGLAFLGLVSSSRVRS